jgi:ubiquinone/menaquinone biosynthesis C-methylase UbiE
MLENDPVKLQTQQYATSKNLDARLALHDWFHTNPQTWSSWLFDQYDFSPNCRILEIGCGAATQWREENRSRIDPTWAVTLVDFSRGMVHTARTATAGLGFNFCVTNAQTLPFADCTFDRVIANHMLYHVPDRAQAFSEIRRVLRQKGRLFAATNSPTSMGELTELVEEAQPNAYGPKAPSQFSLENGGAQMAPYFSTIRIAEYKDALDVTEVQPLVDYVASADPSPKTASPASTHSPPKSSKPRVISTSASAQASSSATCNSLDFAGCSSLVRQARPTTEIAGLEFPYVGKFKNYRHPILVSVCLVYQSTPRSPQPTLR